MRIGVTLRQLEYLVAVADTGQVTRAALRCHVSQSSMTIALGNLERYLGVKLMQRHAKGVRMTRAGERFVRGAQYTLAGLDDAIKEIQRSPDDIRGEVRIGVTETISAYLIPALLESLRKQFPNLRISMEEHDRESIEQGLLDQHFDLGIILISNLKIHDRLQHMTLLRSPRKLWLPADSALLFAEKLVLRDIVDEDYILLDMDEHVETVKSYWGKQGLSPRVVFKSHSLEAVRSLVALGHGVAILSDLVYRPFSLEGRRIVRREMDDDVPSMNVGCAWKREDKLTPGGEAVIDFLRREIDAALA